MRKMRKKQYRISLNGKHCSWRVFCTLDKAIERGLSLVWQAAPSAVVEVLDLRERVLWQAVRRQSYIKFPEE